MVVVKKHHIIVVGNYVAYRIVCKTKYDYIFTENICKCFSLEVFTAYAVFCLKRSSFSCRRNWPAMMWQICLSRIIS